MIVLQYYRILQVLNSPSAVYNYSVFTLTFSETFIFVFINTILMHR